MDRKLKRALVLSALLCPGLGQWVMGRRALGAAMVAASTGLLVLLCVRVVSWMIAMYRVLLSDLQASGDALLDPLEIRALHSRIYLDNWWILLAFLALWFLSVAELYRER